MDELSLAELFARARSGNEEAASELIRQYEGEVRIVVRRRLPQVLRSQFDSMDKFVASNNSDMNYLTRLYANSSNSSNG